jgi:hypothetical protein
LSLNPHPKHSLVPICRFDHSREAKGFSREIAVHPKEGDKIVLKCIKKDITMGEEGLACIRR